VHPLDTDQQDITTEYPGHEHSVDPPTVAIAKAAQNDLCLLQVRISG
jgi:hypothetical protein